MRIVLLAVGRMKQGPERDLLSRYAGRAQASARSVGLTGFDLREVDESRARNPLERKRDEAKIIESDLPAGARLVVLDETGRSVSSPDFAADIGRARDADNPLYAVVVGGPDGLDAAFRSRAGLCIAYGAATFPHQIVRVLAAEQIYRAMTILAGHPYHRA